MYAAILWMLRFFKTMILKKITKPFLTLLFCAMFSCAAFSISAALTVKDLPVSEELNTLLSETGQLDIEEKIAELQSRLIQYTKENRRDAFAFYLLGKAFFDQGAYPEALDSLGTALAIEPELADAHALSAASLSYMAALYDDNGRLLELARKAADAAATLAPDRADFHSLAASVYIASGDLDTAEMALHNTLRLIPAAAADHYRLCMLLIHKKQFRAARYEFSLAIVLSLPENPLSIMPREDMLDMIQPEFGRSEDALKDIQKRMDQAKQKLLADDPGGAIEILEQALAAAPEDPNVLFEIGRIQLENLNDKDAALETFSRAAAASPLHYMAQRGLCLLEPYRQSEDEDKEIPDDEAKRITADCINSIAYMKEINDLRFDLWQDADNVDKLKKIITVLLRYEQYDAALPYIAAVQIHEPENAAATAAMNCAGKRECGEWEKMKNEKQ